MNNGILAPQPFSVATDLVGIKPLLGVPQTVPTPLHFPPVNDFRIGSNDGSSTEDFVLVVDTVKNGTTTVLLSAPGAADGRYSVDWGDGTSGGVIPTSTTNIRRAGSYETVFETTGSSTPIIPHTYAKHGIYRIVIKGVFSVAGTVAAPSMSTQASLIAVESFGREVNKVTTLNYANCINLVSVPTYLPTGSITSLNGSFAGCSSLANNIITWDTSKITNMNSTFQNCSSLNINGSWNWNTSNVTNMFNMFNGATINNANFNNWVFNGTTNGMFFNTKLNSCFFINWSGASSDFMFWTATLNNCTLSGWRITGGSTEKMFLNSLGNNLYLPNWDLRGVTNCSSMFEGSNFARSGLDDWNVSGVTNMERMFINCTDFTIADLSNWNISKVTNFTYFILGSTTTPRASIIINNWKIPSGAILYGMFGGAAANKFTSLSGWSFGGNNAEQMFSDSPSFNNDLTTWNTSGITAMMGMFQRNYTFKGTGVNTDLRVWNTSNVTDMSNMFLACFSLITSVSGWNTSKVTNMSSMFYNAVVWHGSGLETWNTSNVTNMNSMLGMAGGNGYNANLSGWNTGKVTNMGSMFINNRRFDGTSINNWDVTGVTNISSMFEQGASYTGLQCNLSGWNLCNCTNMTNFMLNCNIGTGNYSILLNSWEATSTGNPIKPWATGINVHFGTSKYTAASSGARQRLVNYGWTITDGGFQA